jgi:hypothetical protein
MILICQKRPSYNKRNEKIFVRTESEQTLTNDNDDTHDIIDTHANNTMYQYISCLCGRFHAESQRGQRCNQWPFRTIGSSTDDLIING